jgi:hypothetical protein
VMDEKTKEAHKKHNRTRHLQDPTPCTLALRFPSLSPLSVPTTTFITTSIPFHQPCTPLRPQPTSADTGPVSIVARPYPTLQLSSMLNEYGGNMRDGAGEEKGAGKAAVEFKAVEFKEVAYSWLADKPKEIIITCTTNSVDPE